MSARWGEADSKRKLLRPLLLSSRPEESHPQALPDPCMNLSIHTAPDVRPHPWHSCQWAKGVGFARRSRSNPVARSFGLATQPLKFKYINNFNAVVRNTHPPRPWVSGRFQGLAAGGFWPSPYKSIRAASLEVVESAANFFQHRRGGALREGGPICRGARTSRSHIVQWAIHVFLDPVLRPKIIPRYRERNWRYVIYLE